MTGFPPPNYISAPSQIPGITLFKPAPPQQEQLKAVQQFHCPQCDGVIGYNTEDGGLSCAYCGYHETPTAAASHPTIAAPFEFKVETLQQAAHGWGVARQEIVCQRCAAHTTAEAESLTHRCPFCGSNKVIHHKAAQDVLRPRFLIPFRQTEQQTIASVRQWLGNHWLTPTGLRQIAHMAEFAPVYLPYWSFNAVSNAVWKAQVGHTQTYTTGHGKNRRTHTRTVWRWESGLVNLPVQDLLIAGTSKLDPRLLQQVSQFNMSELQPYDAKFLAGMHAQAYEIGLEDAWRRGREQIRTQTKQACYGQASTQRIRNFSMDLDFSQEAWRYILVPVYMAAYDYQEKPYRVLVNGQTGYIAGHRPVDWIKLWLAIAAALSPGLALIAIAFIATFFESSLSGLIIFAAATLFIIGTGLTIYWLQQANRLENRQ